MPVFFLASEGSSHGDVTRLGGSASKVKTDISDGQTESKYVGKRPSESDHGNGCEGCFKWYSKLSQPGMASSVGQMDQMTDK